MGWRRKVCSILFLYFNGFYCVLKLNIGILFVTCSLGCGIGYGYLHRIPHNENPQETGQETQELVDTRKKTISSALGISAEEGKEPQSNPNSATAPSNPFASPIGPPSNVPSTTTCADHPNGTHSHSPVNIEIPGMPSPHQQTITTPLSIPGMPPITVSAPAMMSGTPFSGAPPTAAPPPTPNDPSWFANAQSQGHQFGPPPPAGGYYNPQAHPQFATTQMFGGAFNQPPQSTGYSPNSVPLFNPVANSTPNVNDNTAPNSNFIRIFDPTAPTSATTNP